MNYLAPITILAAVITTALLFSPASARAQVSAATAEPLPGLVKVLPNGEDIVLEEDLDDALFNEPLEVPPLPAMNRPRGGEYEFITLQHIFFDHNSFALNEEARQLLDSAAYYLVNNDNTVNRILIHGYTNDIDGANYNYRLSDSRAYAVWDYLAGQGVDPERMLVTGLGETHPIDENWTRMGRQRNRRVEIQIIKTSSPR